VLSQLKLLYQIDPKIDLPKNALTAKSNMSRFYELYNQRESHLVVFIFLMFVTNCRYIGTHQPDSICAIFPLLCQCMGIVAWASAVHCRHTVVRQVLRVCIGSIWLGAITSTVLSIVYIHHLLQCTVSILNAYALAVIGTDLWIYQNEELVADSTETTINT
jgi:hypothetical protein